MVVSVTISTHSPTRSEKVEIQQPIGFGDLWVLAFDSAQIEV
jgi:hypothetical protein